MKICPRLNLLIALSVILPSLESSSRETFFLPRSLDCYQGKLPTNESKQMNNYLWDFSAAEHDEASLIRYDFYGDSLISEITGGYRRWYKVRNDSIFLTREETPLMAILPDSYVPSAAFSNKHEIYTTSETEAFGSYSQAYKFHSRIIYGSMSGTTGKVVLAPGDTVVARMSYEKRLNVITGDGGSLVDSFEDEVWRWFEGGIQAPVAIAISRKSKSPEGKLLDLNSVVHVVDASEYNDRRTQMNESEPEADSESVEAISIAYRNGSLRLSLGEGYNYVSGSLDITDPSGVSFFHTSFRINPGEQSEIPLSSLQPHSYIVVLSSGGAVVKRAINIW